MSQRPFSTFSKLPLNLYKPINSSLSSTRSLVFTILLPLITLQNPINKLPIDHVVISIAALRRDQCKNSSAVISPWSSWKMCKLCRYLIHCAYGVKSLESCMLFDRFCYFFSDIPGKCVYMCRNLTAPKDLNLLNPACSSMFSESEIICPDEFFVHWSVTEVSA